MKWSDVGSWVKKHGGALLGVVGALATGGTSAGAAAAISLLAEATGEQQPAAALAKLQSDPATMLRLEELAAAREKDLRDHHREMFRMELEDEQAAHKQQQDTIRAGDSSADEYVRHTRPKMARQSWYVGAAYVVAFEALRLAGIGNGAAMELALVLLSPAGAYLGFRTFDKVFGKRLPPS